VIRARSKSANADFDRATPLKASASRPHRSGDDAQAAALIRAKARLDTLDWYPEPVRIERVRIHVAPWFFRIPGFRRYRAYAFWRTILVKEPNPSDDLVTHELCHIWQGQQRALHVSFKHVTTRYRSNPYELQARRAVEATRRHGSTGHVPGSRPTPEAPHG
jgi:hypothetical protein